MHDQISRKRPQPTAVPTILSFRNAVKKRPSWGERKKTALERIALFKLAMKEEPAWRVGNLRLNKAFG